VLFLQFISKADKFILLLCSERLQSYLINIERCINLCLRLVSTIIRLKFIENDETLFRSQRYGGEASPTRLSILSSFHKLYPTGGLLHDEAGLGNQEKSKILDSGRCVAGQYIATEKEKLRFEKELWAFD
jgi:hypothetical protein